MCTAGHAIRQQAPTMIIRNGRGAIVLRWIRRPNASPLLAKLLKRYVQLLVSTLIVGASRMAVSAPLTPLTLPTGPHMVAGQSLITSSGNSVRVQQQSEKAIINWDTFNIGTQASVSFNQPNSTSVALNRVVSGDPSQILGGLTSNGRVFLVNPAGVLFGTGARVDVGGIVASTLDIQDSDFLHGNYKFTRTGSSGVITNQGSLNANSGGYVALLAPEVRNEGVVTAKLGTIILAGAEVATLDMVGDGLIGVKVDPATVKTLIENKSLVEAVGGTVVLAVNTMDKLLGSSISNTGTISASSLTNDGGVIRLQGDTIDLSATSRISSAGKKGGDVNIDSDVLFQNGSIDVGGAAGGAIAVSARRVLLGGNMSAAGAISSGGKIQIAASERMIQTSGSSLNADGQTHGGAVYLDAGDSLFSSGRISASSGDGAGGNITASGNQVILQGAELHADGASAGGAVLVGGDLHGANGAVRNAVKTDINFSTNVSADANQLGNGGKVVVWSDDTTSYYGNISARGGATAGNGGQIEVSGKNSLTFGGMATASASHGAQGNLLLDPKNITISSAAPGLTSFELVDPNPGVGNNFGQNFTVLPNGNVIVLSNVDDFVAVNSGAVYLYNGKTGALISSLLGSKAGDQVGQIATVLANGNFVVGSKNWNGGVGAATWGSATTGVSGAVSASNSVVGTKAGDAVGIDITALANGNYVVRSPFWDSGAVVDVGAVSWGNGSVGTTGVVTAANSLVGGKANDLAGSGGITALANGNYVVRSPAWDNGALINAGAATWGSGATGITGLISASNSLVGGKTADQVSNGGVTALTNGNYVVRSSLWDNGAISDAGAVTWGNGATGTTGLVTPANSLVGIKSGDQIGSGGIVRLSNGNYVVSSPLWDNGAVADAGAATWASGAAAISGAVTAANSLVGSSSADQIGGGSITPMANGNYIVVSPLWNSGAVADTGAVTWSNGASGSTGAVTAANSLVGGTAGDQVGSGGITLLTNGNYVVSSPNWNNGLASKAGAATWANGASGVAGKVSVVNSLVGATANDQVGSKAITALTNGNYVVVTPTWNNGAATSAGAATWGNGATGISGIVSPVNSLVGTSTDDQVGNEGVAALTNGNYVVGSSFWNNGAALRAGAATWGAGATGATGVVSVSNSLVGSKTEDRVGEAIALTNGNYVLRDQLWSSGVQQVGSTTWGNGTTGTTGVVTEVNSVVGMQASDLFSSSQIVVLPNGNYAAFSPSYDNGANTNAGAVTLIDGSKAIAGTPSTANSLFGQAAGEMWGLSSYGILSDGNLLLANPRAARGSFSQSGRIYIVQNNTSNTLPFNASAGASVTLTPAAVSAITSSGTSLTLQANNDIVLAPGSDIVTSAHGVGGDLTLQAGRSIQLNSKITTDNGNLTVIANERLANGVIDNYRDSGNAVISMAAGTSIQAGSGKVTLDLRDGAGKTHFESGAITASTINASQITLANEGISSGSDVVVNGVLTASGSGDAIVVAGKRFLNNAGDTPLMTLGRWLIYSSASSQNAFGGMQSPGNLFGRTYANNAPSTIDAAWGNRFIYEDRPTLTVTANNATRIYGDSDPNFIYGVSGLLAGDSPDSALSGKLSAGATSRSKVGSYAITQGTLADQLGYKVQYEAATLDVSRRAINLSGAKSYDGGTALNSYSLGNVMPGDEVTATGSARFADKNVGVAKPLAISDVALNGQDAGNYLLAGGEHTGDITPRKLSVTAIGNNKVYDATKNASVSIIDDRLAGDFLVLSSSASTFSDKNAGNGKIVTVGGITLSGADAKNYALATTVATTSANISKASLALTATNGEKVYDGTTASNGLVEAVGLVGNDTVNGLSQSYDSKNTGARLLTVDAAYNLQDGNGGNNYAVTTNSASGKINKAVLSLSAISDSKVYDGSTASTGMVDVKGLIEGDTVTAITQTFDSRNAGARTLSVDAGYRVNDGNGSNNYMVVVNTAAGKIAQRPITVNAVSNTKFHDGTVAATANPVLVSGILAPGDTATYRESYADSHVGNGKLLIPSAVVGDGNDGNNYHVSLVASPAGVILPNLSGPVETSKQILDLASRPHTMPALSDIDPEIPLESCKSIRGAKLSDKAPFTTCGSAQKEDRVDGLTGPFN